MELPEKSTIIAKLKSSGYEDDKAEEILHSLSNIDNSLIPALVEWVEKDTIADITIEGYSLKSLVDNNMKPPAAFLTLDWLIREPDSARAAIESGYDSIKSK